MNNVVISMDSIIAPLVLISLTIIWLTVSVRTIRGAGQHGEIAQDGNVRVYKISGWLYLCAGFLLCLGLYAIFDGIVKIGMVSSFFLCGFGLFPFLMGIYCIYFFRRTFVKVGIRDLTYSYGRKEIRVEFSTIRSVAVANGLIFIDVGDKHNVIIPIAFCKTSEIYNILCMHSHKNAVVRRGSEGSGVTYEK